MQTQEMNLRNDLTATYSPEDNKLRLYSLYRLEKETYDRLHSNGFRYAPKQKLFVAPMWTPTRARLLNELCGAIEDEQTSLEDRAQERAERFEGYQTKRKTDAESAYKQVQEITKNIPMGQPILVGHHSEKKARREAKRIEQEMQKAVKMWETSEYWERRAKGVVGHANYKERPDVRLRRIKKLEAEKRKFQREIDNSKKFLELWTSPEKELTFKRARTIANYDRVHKSFPLTEYPRSEDKSQYEGSISLWSALEFITPEQAKGIALQRHEKTISFYTEWVNHTILRLQYERTILEAQGYKEPEKKKRPKLPAMVNYPGEGFKHITKEEWSKKHRDYKGTKTKPESEAHEAYRYRQMVCFDGPSYLTPVFITDQKIVEPPRKERVAC